ncbi:MAG: YggL family protein, partial [Acidobacteriota bacterium]|nr:YggL family protein [Acidobacteriota bacterium]
MIKSKLKRRLRKKFHVGEFQELGFEILVDLKSDLPEIEFD